MHNEEEWEGGGEEPPGVLWLLLTFPHCSHYVLLLWPVERSIDSPVIADGASCNRVGREYVAWDCCHKWGGGWIQNGMSSLCVI